MGQFFSVRSFYYWVAIQSSAINVLPLSIVKMRETSRLFILISAYEGGAGHVYSQSRGSGKRKIFWDSAPDPDIFCPPPPNKNSWRRHWQYAIDCKKYKPQLHLYSYYLFADFVTTYSCKILPRKYIDF